MIQTEPKHGIVITRASRHKMTSTCETELFSINFNNTKRNLGFHSRLYVYKPAELDDFREIFVNISRDIRDIRNIVVVLPYSGDQNRKQICTDIINSNINRQDAEGM